MTEKLKRCPFCNSKAEICEDKECGHACSEIEYSGSCLHSYYFITCTNDNCNEPQNSKEDAITAWNTRHEN